MLSAFLPQGLVGFGKAEAFNGDGAARSRSTSAGRSSLSDSQGCSSAQLTPPLSPPTYCADTLGLPEYDYPTPWSIQLASQLPDIDYPMPFVMKNTFMGFDVCRPASLEEFYAERQTKSCPASGIGLPPGLEDLVAPEEAAAKLAFAEAAFLREAMEEASYHLPGGLLDAQLDYEAPQFWPAPPVADFCGQQFSSGQSFFSPSMQAAEPLPLLLDSLVNPLEQVQQAPFYDAQFANLAAPAWAAQPAHALPELELGSPECPTVGSEGHHLGTCRPCAFLYTKGCGNGVLCSFCHLCDAGEKKRRAKDKRAANRNARQWGC